MAWSSDEDNFIPAARKIALRNAINSRLSKERANNNVESQINEIRESRDIFRSLVQQQHSKRLKLIESPLTLKTKKVSTECMDTPITVKYIYDERISSSKNRQKKFVSKLKAIALKEEKKRIALAVEKRKREDPFYITTSEESDNESIVSDNLNVTLAGKVEPELNVIYPQKHLLSDVYEQDDYNTKLSKLYKGFSYSIPDYIARHLRYHQIEGISWLYDKFCDGSGSILNDDMGLGKTIQVIGLLATLLRKTGSDLDRRIIRYKQGSRVKSLVGLTTYEQEVVKSTASSLYRGNTLVFKGAIIVVPSSLCTQWESELNIWGHFSILNFQGLQSGEEEEYFVQNVKNNTYEVIIFSYDLFKKYFDRDLYSRKSEQTPINGDTVFHKLLERNLDVLILDEMHVLKNKYSGLANCVQRISSLPIIGLTGTIFQNNYKELHTLLDFIQGQNNCLGEYEQFRQNYVQPILKSTQKAATPVMKEIGLQRSRLLREKIKGYVLRRNKSVLISNLPQKFVYDIFLKLSGTQYKIYNNICSSIEVQAVIDKVDMLKLQTDGYLWRSLHVTGEKCKYCPRSCLTFPLLARFNHIVNHLDLVRRIDSNSDLGRQFLDYIGLKDTLLSGEKSSKLRVLLGLLKIWKQNESKVLLFSNSTAMLDIIQASLSNFGYWFQRLDGSMNKRSRDMAVRKFQSERDVFIFLISTKAGGVGLNLTAADIVVSFDPCWNPSYDLQAQDRAFRIGQTKNVKVYRFFSFNTIEQQIFVRQMLKVQLSKVATTDIKPKIYFEGYRNGKKEEQGITFGLRNLLIHKNSEAKKAFDEFAQGESSLDMKKLQQDELVFLRENGAEVILLTKSSDSYKETTGNTINEDLTDIDTSISLFDG